MKLTDMKQVLAERGIQLTKSLGQNFLHDANQLGRIVAAADLTKADRVLEVGPGLGPLTEMLLEQAGEVLAIEKDARLVEVLKKRFQVDSMAPMPRSAAINLPEPGRTPLPSLSPRSGERVAEGRERGGSSDGQECRLSPPPIGTGGTPVLRLLHDDALDYLKRNAQDWSEWKLVANLPYSVASPILVELALGPGGRASSRAQVSREDGAREDARPPKDPGPSPARARGPRRMVATLQIEVAKRLMAKAGAPDYGLLSLLVQLDYEPQDWFKIPASCFFPEPDVDSACVCLVRREPPLLGLEQRKTFIQIVKRSFSQRRKMMLKLLKQDWPQPRLAQEFERLALSPSIRAEKVSLEQFVRLAEKLPGPS